MDLKSYYRKIRSVASELGGGDVVIVSLETPQGGKAGVMTEVPSRIAARAIVEGRARPATAEESERRRVEAMQAYEEAHRKAAAERVKVMVVPEVEGKRTKASPRSKA